MSRKEEIQQQLSTINEGINPNVNWIGLIYELAEINKKEDENNQEFLRVNFINQ